MCFHDAPGKFAVVVYKQVRWGENVLIGLTEKVDKAIMSILAKEGNDGYGDFWSRMAGWCRNPWY